MRDPRRLLGAKIGAAQFDFKLRFGEAVESVGQVSPGAAASVLFATYSHAVRRNQIDMDTLVGSSNLKTTARVRGIQVDTRVDTNDRTASSN